MLNYRFFIQFFFLLTVGTLSAQTLRPLAAQVQNFQNQNGQFYHASLFEAAPIADRLAQTAASDAQGLDLDLKTLSRVMKENPAGMTLSLPYHNQLIKVNVLRAQVVSEDFAVVTSESNGQPVAVTQGLHFRGVVEGDPNSIVAISLFEREVMGLISTAETGNMVLGRIETPGNYTNYILFQEAKLEAPFDFHCATEDHDELELPSHTQGAADATAVNGCVRVFIEADYELYQNKGSNVQNTVDYLTGIFNQVATLYANETISTVFSANFVWTTADSYSNTSSSTALTQFKNTRTTFTGDIAHLASLGGQNIGGVAWVDVLCNNTYRYAYSNISSSYSNVPTYSWTVEVMTHEMGHNLGSNHTQWCGWTGGALDNCYTTEGGCAAGPAPTNGGTIMSYCHLTSYGINFANGFGTQPGNVIRTEVSTAACLAATCGGGGGTTCQDQYESNNTRNTAKVIPVNTAFTAQIATSTDKDWYKFSNTSATPKIKVEMTTLPADYDVKLYRNTTQVGVSQNSGTANETIIYNTTTVANNYYAYVYGYNGAYSNSSCYTLKVSLSSANWLAGESDDRTGNEKTFEIPVVFEDAGFGIYPNPAADHVMIEVPAYEEASTANITLTDVAGKVLRTQERLVQSESNNQFVFDLSQVQNGVYFVTVRQGENVNTRILKVNR